MFYNKKRLFSGFSAIKMAIKVTVLGYALHSGVNEIIVRDGHRNIELSFIRCKSFEATMRPDVIKIMNSIFQYIIRAGASKGQIAGLISVVGYNKVCRIVSFRFKVS